LLFRQAMNTAKRPKPSTARPVTPRAPRAARTAPPDQPAPAPRRARRVTAPTAPPELSTEIIAIRAYQIFEARAGAAGDALGDWLQAEAELTVVPAPRRRGTQPERTAATQ
jgi:hypothetical protein